MPAVRPTGLISTLDGRIKIDMNMRDFPRETEVNLSFKLHFNDDLDEVMIGQGFPTVVIDNSAPLSPATNGVSISLLEAELGTFDVDGGRMELPITLRLAWRPDAKETRDVNMILRSRPGMWDSSRVFLGLLGDTQYEFQRSVRTLEVNISGQLRSPPLRKLPRQPSHPAACSSNPAADRLDLFARGTDGAVWYRRLGGNPWSSSTWQTLGGVVTSDPAALAAGPELIYVFARGLDNDLVFQTHSSRVSAQAWSSLGGILSSGPSACSAKQDTIDVYYRANREYLFRQSFDSFAWSGQVLSLAGHECYSDPSVMAIREGRWIFVRGYDNAVYYWSERERRNMLPSRLDGIATSAPAVCSPDPERDSMMLFIRGPDNAIWYRRFDGVGVWSEWMSLGGFWITGPAATAMGGLAWVFVQGTDSLYYYLWIGGPGQQSGWQRLDGAIP